jgi:hypothetical protein
MEFLTLLPQVFASKEDRLSNERLQELIETGTVGDHRRDRVIPFDPDLYAAMVKEFEGGK